MRMMMKVSIPVEAGNKAIADGSLPKTIGAFIEKWKPEGAYFTTDEGNRCGYFFVDLPTVADIPAMAEPFFMAFNAKITVLPAMNGADMAAGVAKSMAR